MLSIIELWFLIALFVLFIYLLYGVIRDRVYILVPLPFVILFIFFLMYFDFTENKSFFYALDLFFQSVVDFLILERW